MIEYLWGKCEGVDEMPIIGSVKKNDGMHVGGSEKLFIECPLEEM